MNELTITNNEEKKEIYCSFTAETHADKAKMYNMMNNPQEKVAAHINEVIKITDIFMEMVEITNQDTGEVSKAPRIVLMDTEGITYATVSFGIFSALKKLIMIFGEPTWEDGIPIKIKQIQKDKNSILTLEVQ